MLSRSVCFAERIEDSEQRFQRLYEEAKRAVGVEVPAGVELLARTDYAIHISADDSDIVRSLADEIRLALGRPADL